MTTGSLSRNVGWIALGCLLSAASPSRAHAQSAAFPLPLDLRLDPNGRDAKLLAAFAYVDGRGQRVEVPKDTSVDGASIPWPLWSLIGSPWTGKYREASVIHDYLCDTKTKPWSVVHRIFYEAMLANDVNGVQAKIMYAAVYRFGPRWDFEYTPTCPNCAAVPRRVATFTPEFDRGEFEALKAKAEADPPIEALETEADAQFFRDIRDKEIGRPVFIR